MQKRTEPYHRFHSGIPLIVSIALGFLLFGAYLAVERVLPQTPPTWVAAVFLIVYATLAVCIYTLFRIKQIRSRGEYELNETLNTKMHNMFKYVVALPYVIVDEQGRVRVINDALQELLGTKDPFYRGNLSDLCGGVTLRELLEAQRRKPDSPLSLDAKSAAASEPEVPRVGAGFRVAENGLVIRLSDCGRYTARAYELGLGGKMNYLVTFTDVTELLDLQEKTDREMPAVAYIDVDNLEELTQYTHSSYRDVSRRVDDVLLRWATEMNGLLREYERDRYIMLFSQEKLRESEESRFGRILDTVRDIRLGEYSIPVTVSVGISLSEGSMAERAKEAESALDMALQRGGDQVAVRRHDGIRYYGGETRPFRRRTKVQSRVVANYLLSKISESSNLLIMGHRNPDFDCIGAAVGVAQLGLFAGVPTKIVSNLSDTNFRVATERLITNPLYADMFVSAHKGLDLIRPGTLLIITDANNFNIIESSEVAKSVQQVSGKIAIVDHHMQTGEYDFEPVMNYIDPSASSTCELLAEMLEQIETGGDNDTHRALSDEVASVMLSGIMLDTGGFTRNTGMRTLDAARYLYGKGANAERVSIFFNQSYEDYVRERSFSGCRLLQGNTVGLTWSAGTGQGADDRVAAAKEADRLLTVRGVGASFALVKIDDAIHISGRSDGSINVQLILERLGGGGRFDSAGAALTDVSLASAIENLESAVAGYFADKEAARRSEGAHPTTR